MFGGLVRVQLFKSYPAKGSRSTTVFKQCLDMLHLSSSRVYKNPLVLFTVARSPRGRRISLAFTLAVNEWMLLRSYRTCTHMLFPNHQVRGAETMNHKDRWFRTNCAKSSYNPSFFKGMTFGQTGRFIAIYCCLSAHYICAL